jgi:hypothetical protein
MFQKPRCHLNAPVEYTLLLVIAEGQAAAVIAEVCQAAPVIAEGQAAAVIAEGPRAITDGCRKAGIKACALISVHKSIPDPFATSRTMRVLLISTLVLALVVASASHASRTLHAAQACGCDCGQCGSYKLFGVKNCNCCCWNAGSQTVDAVQEAARTKWPGLFGGDSFHGRHAAQVTGTSTRLR